MPVRASWSVLRGLNVKTGEITPELKRLLGPEVRLLGFMVPLDDDARFVTEFLLVLYMGACIHVPPPPANQIVHVKLPAGKAARMDWRMPVWVVARLDVLPTESPYGTVSFRMQCARVERWDRYKVEE